MAMRILRSTVSRTTFDGSARAGTKFLRRSLNFLNFPALGPLLSVTLSNLKGLSA